MRLAALVVGIALSIVTAEASAQVVPRPVSSQTEKRLFDRINAIRAEHRLPRLTNDERLSESAREFSCRLARDDFFGHVSTSGQTFTDRVRAAGLDYRAAAENIAKNVGAKNPVERAVQGWMKSPGHRANILSKEFTVSGIGICARGTAFYFTHIFLRPR